MSASLHGHRLGRRASVIGLTGRRAVRHVRRTRAARGRGMITSQRYGCWPYRAIVGSVERVQWEAAHKAGAIVVGDFCRGLGVTAASVADGTGDEHGDRIRMAARSACSPHGQFVVGLDNHVVLHLVKPADPSRGRQDMFAGLAQLGRARVGPVDRETRAAPPHGRRAWRHVRRPRAARRG